MVRTLSELAARCIVSDATLFETAIAYSHLKPLLSEAAKTCASACDEAWKGVRWDVMEEFGNVYVADKEDGRPAVYSFLREHPRFDATLERAKMFNWDSAETLWNISLMYCTRMIFPTF